MKKCTSLKISLFIFLLLLTGLSFESLSSFSQLTPISAYASTIQKKAPAKKVVVKKKIALKKVTKTPKPAPSKKRMLKKIFPSISKSVPLPQETPKKSFEIQQAQEIKKEVSPSKSPTLKQHVFVDGTLTSEGVFLLTNNERTLNGNLPNLIFNNLLTKAAEAKVQDMFQNQYFEHVSPSGKGPSDLAKQADYHYILIGENLALGMFKNDSELITGWMNSPGHRANILNHRFQEIGIAVKKGLYNDELVWLAVQEFGKPLSACTEPDKVLKNLIETEKQENETLKDILTQKKNELDSLKTNQTDFETIRTKVDEYNLLIASFNEKIGTIKKYVHDYNSQVASFNTCINQ